MEAQVFQCGLCVETFKTKSKFMYHRKESHVNIVKMCRKESSECIFGDRCWYKHTTNENKSEPIENSNDLIQRLFGMMENFAKKLEVLETRS